MNFRSISIVVTQLEQPDVLPAHFVDHAVLAVDPPGSAALKGVLERLGFANASERFSGDLLL